MPATHNLKDQTVLVIGRGSGLARAVVRAARDAGARVIDRDLITDEVGPSRQP